MSEIERTTLFADVIVPLGVPNNFTYRVPYEWNELVAAGQRVVIQFGKSKYYVGVIKKLHEQAPKEYKAKYIEDILDAKPVVNELQLNFWEWVSTYYMCNPGDVMNAALPNGLRFGSETRIIKNESFSLEETSPDYFTEREWKLVEVLELKIEMSIAEVADALGIKNVQPILQKIIAKGAARMMEEMKGEFKPRKEDYVRFTPEMTEEKLHQIFNELEKKAFVQLQILMKFVQLIGGFDSAQPPGIERSRNDQHDSAQPPGIERSRNDQHDSAQPPGIERSRNDQHIQHAVRKTELLKQSNGSLASLNQLVLKGVFEIFEEEVSRLALYNKTTEPPKKLSEAQQEALDKIKESFSEKNVVLLHGVTSSGKTEIYMELIEEMIQQDKKVLYLLPEIALTGQLVNRLKKRWGNKVGVYHSRYSDNERVEVWNSLLKGAKESKVDYSVIIGTRSALFLPFQNLGLIIVDEEHDGSYKQQDPSPRYNARDASIYLAHLTGAKVILGSATPSVESYYNAVNNKFGLVELQTRFGGMEMPEIVVCDLKEETRRKLMKSIFSPYLLTSIEEALKNEEQVILFQNRRGFAHFIECKVCNHVPQCQRCDVSLTYHKKADLLKCHYCGFSMALPKVCPACGSPLIETRGFGTEKIEEELALFFPDARIARLDLDSTRAKNSHTTIINQFEEKKVDILVGTQMVTKGLDFDNVSIVGILNADAGLYFPDFRSAERTYQLMAQVSGRAGRKNKRGKVIIQTFNTGHPIIDMVVKNDYSGMYESQIEERKNFSYPPFTRLIEITMSHRNEQDLDAMAPELADLLKKRFGNNRVLGPEYPVVSRIQNYYIKKILLKIEREKYSVKIKEMVVDSVNQFLKKGKDYARMRIKIDVDPQ